MSRRQLFRMMITLDIGHAMGKPPIKMLVSSWENPIEDDPPCGGLDDGTVDRHTIFFSDLYSLTQNISHMPPLEINLHLW